MLIPLHELIEKYKLKIKGIIHLGANEGQEANDYWIAGVRKIVWVEAIEEMAKKCCETSWPYQWEYACICACVSDIDGEEIEFNVSSNEGQSSSMFELGTHAVVHPSVTYIDKIKMKTKRVDTIFKDHVLLHIEDYNFVNADLQGAELKALKGMGELLNHIDYLYLEVNKDYLYKGCCLIGELDEFLSDFQRVETSWAGATGWGDCFMIRKTLL